MWASIGLGCVLFAPSVASAQVVCSDPPVIFFPQPRPSCTWNTTDCDWVCPGYAGRNVTVQVLQPPTTAGTVFLSLEQTCPNTILNCSVPLSTSATETAAQHCQLLAGAAASPSCVNAGFVVKAGACTGAHPTFTVSNHSSCPTFMAAGISQVQSQFDQTYLGALSDGELDAIMVTAVPALPGAWLPILAALLGLGAVVSLWRSRRREHDRAR
jgi:hypothetical protein